ncbi:hypothetical protein HYC85_021659 [Camellia sinensis]|uniref:Uncharacterized protein n=1 Tax=Camellia sinensis TaxID=4442 RepID=A0A7J7GI89_CAMSI|nr:hypothetical protein HYC85_021659 [Camellia sinensis]
MLSSTAAVDDSTSSVASGRRRATPWSSSSATPLSLSPPLPLFSRFGAHQKDNFFFLTKVISTFNFMGGVRVKP